MTGNAVPAYDSRNMSPYVISRIIRGASYSQYYRRAFACFIAVLSNMWHSYMAGVATTCYSITINAP